MTGNPLRAGVGAVSAISLIAVYGRVRGVLPVIRHLEEQGGGGIPTHIGAVNTRQI